MNLKTDAFQNTACIFILTLGFFVFWCNAPDSETTEHIGAELPNSESIVKLADVMNNPDAFTGKRIVMKGIVSEQCESLCEFLFKDGNHIVPLYPQGFKLPKLAPEKPVAVYTEIIKGREQMVFLALGIKI